MRRSFRLSWMFVCACDRSVASCLCSKRACFILIVQFTVRRKRPEATGISFFDQYAVVDVLLSIIVVNRRNHGRRPCCVIVPWLMVLEGQLWMGHTQQIARNSEPHAEK